MKGSINKVRCFVCGVFVFTWLLANDEIVTPSSLESENEARFRSKQDALRRAKNAAQEINFSFDELKRQFATKREALQKAVEQARGHAQYVLSAKSRALAEVCALSKFIVERQQAEARAIALVEKMLEQENPHLNTDMMLLAKFEAELGSAQPVEDLENLPLLAHGLPMNYLPVITPRADELIAKQTSFAPTPPTPAEREAARRQIEAEAETKRKIEAEVQRIMAQKPQAQPKATPKEKRLSELLNLYKADKISPGEYYSRRSKILSEP